MRRKKFICELISDVIINHKAATEGNQESLDFIPGASFLGIVAGELYDEINNEESFDLFHNTKVLFGDAHPMADGFRSFRVPASLYIKKGENIFDEAYVHHGLPADRRDVNNQPVQLKQMRQGYVVKASNDRKAHYFPIKKAFSIKSAYDRVKRRAEDAKMYGYEAIQSGLKMCFEVAFDESINDDIIQRVVKALTGHKRVGRSSTAQYGLVKIVEQDFKQGFESVEKADSLIIYAESRLAFIDQYGSFTYQPETQDLGIMGNKGRINWKKSQIRTFQYAPYNNKRQNRDADRIGIEKGSVFFIEGATSQDVDSFAEKNGIGCFKNEGFGKILVNPCFLLHDKEGKSLYKFEKPVPGKTSFNGGPLYEVDKLVKKYLESKQKETEDEIAIYDKVNAFVKSHAKIFSKASFSSQWGTIRMKAMTSSNKEQLSDKLFKDKEGYLVHGVAKDKWEGKKLNALKGFLDNIPEQIAIRTMVNLAAEMAKLSRKEDRTDDK
jgi:hypothetical protein